MGKGHPSSRKGQTKENNDSIKAQSEKMKLKPRWNKGLTAETDPRVARIAEVCKVKNKGQVPWSKGKPAWNRGLTKETDERVAKQAISSKGVSHPWSSWNKGLTKGDDERLQVMSEKISKTITGRTKETHPGIKAQSLKLTGRNKDNDPAFKAISEKLTGRKTGRSWSTGLTKETDPRLASAARKKKGMLAGSNHPNWIDGRSYLKYPVEFTKGLRSKINKRDGYACQYCGVSESSYWRKLDTHHIDYDRFNCNELNLITLCHTCNIKANANREHWQRFFTDKLLIKLNKVSIYGG
jgi:hypothetical protein